MISYCLVYSIWRYRWFWWLFPQQGKHFWRWIYTASVGFRKDIYKDQILKKYQKCWSFFSFSPRASMFINFSVVSEDDFRHGPSPSTWSNNERFFFTRPQQKRGRPSRPREKFFVGDPSQCTTGSCEFFLFCWLSGGVVEGGCGGFLMSCCNRPNQFGHKVIVEQVGPKFEAQSTERFLKCKGKLLIFFLLGISFY